MSKELDKRYAYSTDGLPHTDFGKMQTLQDETLTLCQKKDSEYGASWCRRGGVGAFFTIWRKADRLEEQLKKVDFNIFDVSDDPNSTESLDETIRDFANYLYLALEKRKAIRERDAMIKRRANEAGVDLSPEEPLLVRAAGASIPPETWAKAAGVDLKALSSSKRPEEDECGK